jgi:hypothetical protein
MLQALLGHKLAQYCIQGMPKDRLSDHHVANPVKQLLHVYAITSHDNKDTVAAALK